MQRRRTAILFLTFALTTGCGNSGEQVPPTTTATTEPPSTTTTIRQGIVCLDIATRALALFNSYLQEQRGIVAPDVDSYARRAEAIREEARAAGCTVPLRNFP